MEFEKYMQALHKLQGLMWVRVVGGVVAMAVRHVSGA
jgi:hypothetical protein